MLSIKDAAYCYTFCGVVSLCVFLSVTLVYPAKTVELIEVWFGTWTCVDPKSHVLGGKLLPVWYCGGDAAFCQITLTSCYKDAADGRGMATRE